MVKVGFKLEDVNIAIILRLVSFLDSCTYFHLNHLGKEKL